MEVQFPKQPVLLKTQGEWINDDEPLKLLEKGRRTGGSWVEASDAVMIAASDKKEGGQNVYYIPQTKEDAIEFIETCAKWAKALDYASSTIKHGSYEDESSFWEDKDDADKNIKTYVIQLPNSGHRIVALSSAPSRIRGKQGVIIIDEAAYQQSLAKLLKSAMALLLRGGKVRVISTHDGEDNPFNKLKNEILSGDRKGKVYTYPFRKAVAEGMYKRICELDGKPWSQDAEDKWVQDAYDYYGDDAPEELDCIPSSGEGAYIPSILIDRAAVVEQPVIRWSYKDSYATKPLVVRTAETEERLKEEVLPLLKELNKKLDKVYGMDYARVGDLSVLAPAVIQQNLVRRTPFMIELRNCPTQQQRQIIYFIIDNLTRFQSGAMDATGNGETIAEDTWEIYGERIQRIKLHDSFYGTYMPLLKEAFEDGLIQIPRDADVRRDIKKIVKQRGIPKLDPKGSYEGSDGEQRHGDAAIALLLMWVASLMDVAEYAYHSVPNQRRNQQADRLERQVRTTAGFNRRGGIL